MLTVEQKPAGEPKGRQGVQQLSGEPAEKAGTICGILLLWIQVNRHYYQAVFA